MGVITVEGLGQVEIAGDAPTAQEQAAIIAHLQSLRPAAQPTASAPPPGSEPPKRELEFPDAPTFAAINHSSGLKKYKSPIDALMNIGEASQDLWDKGGAMLAGSFGPLMTDNPKARQEIVAKQLPGAEAFDDKFGNPMIRHDGKVYYASRPGVDAMDIGRAGLGMAATAPLALAAPASALGIAALGGATSGVQSLAEDALTGMAGGTSQPIDLTKAGLSTLFGATVPLGVNKIVNSAMPASRYVSAKLTGGIPARATKALADAGIDAATLTADQLKTVAAHGLKRGWNNQEMNTALMKSLSDKYKVPLTQGQVTGVEDLISLEDQLRHGAYGQSAKTQLKEFGVDQNQALNEAAAGVRRGVTGSPTKLEPEDIGKTLVREFNAENTAAKRAVTQAYDDAFDRAKLQAAGAQPAASRADVRNLQPNLDNAFIDPATGVVEQVTPVLNPNTIEGVKFLKQFSETGALPGAFPNVAPPANTLTGPTDWKTVESARKYINSLRVAAKANPADARSLGMVLDAFDNTFTPGNPLIGNARKLHSERVNLFNPQKRNATGINAPLEILNNPNNAGMAAYNRIMDGALKTGEGAPLIAHLKKVYANSPDAMTALKEGMLSRILVNKKTNEVLTAGRARTALQTALKGQEGAAYRELFQGSQLSEMGRFQDLLTRIAETVPAINASKSGYTPSQLIRKSGAAIRGGLIGGTIGGAFGAPIPVIGPLMGAGIGASVGSGIGAMAATGAGNRAANRAVSGALPSAGFPRRTVPMPAGYLSNQVAPPEEVEQRARGGYLRKASH